VTSFVKPLCWLLNSKKFHRFTATISRDSKKASKIRPTIYQSLAFFSNQQHMPKQSECLYFSSFFLSLKNNAFFFTHRQRLANLMQYFISFYDNAVMQLDVLFFMAGPVHSGLFLSLFVSPYDYFERNCHTKKTSSKKWMIFRCQKLGIQIKKAHFSKKYLKRAGVKSDN